MERRASAFSKGRRRQSISECITEISVSDLLDLENSSINNVNHVSENAPMVWERMSNGYRIVDLKEERIIEAIKLIKNDFLKSEPMCCATHVKKDFVSAKSYLQLILRHMRDLESLCALKEGTGDLVGVLIGSNDETVDKYYNEIQLNQGLFLSKIINLRNCLFAKAGVTELFGTGKFYQINVLCVEMDHRNKGIGTALVRSCISRVNQLRIPGCVAAFSSAAAQTIGERLNFEKVTEISYRNFVTPHNNAKPFNHIPAGNFSISCMILVTNSPDEDKTALNSNRESQSKSSAKVKRKKK
ncbi:uncharacterized protein LOC107270103 [Cephus cinctus]|uniref:Uncharacterized protein LOC107270103 n=1 Tax=Cephus cinctus TaxID=211228 RepID=A0AAJ7RML3_CEPCN|nr:uncharacterized protein LOC107270103 [Cephus cinctus]